MKPEFSKLFNRNITKQPVDTLGKVVNEVCMCPFGRLLADSGRGFYQCLSCTEPKGSHYENGVCVCPADERAKKNECVKCPANSFWNEADECQCNGNYQKTASEECILCFGPGWWGEKEFKNFHNYILIRKMTLSDFKVVDNFILQKKNRKWQLKVSFEQSQKLLKKN